MIRSVCVVSLAVAGLALSRSLPAQVTTAPVILRDRLGHQVALAVGPSLTVTQAGLGELDRVMVSTGYRVTFCDGPGLRALCRRLVGPAGNTSAPFVPPLTAASTLVTVERALFGYADLHAHPATHLAFGSRGGQGLLWGLPGMSSASGPNTVLADLRACANDNHTGFVADPLVQLARTTLVDTIERDNPNHGPSGADTFTDWPAADSVIHQQMHVTMLRRAWEGGLRLMVASATDSQVLDVVWNPNNSVSQGRAVLRADFEYKAAVRQLDFIRQFVAANASWMAIATTPAEARQAIDQNKLAVVLGLELDELSMDQILRLKADYGVALVGPIHLVNNSFGGTAVYEDFFNDANYVLNGRFFRVSADADLDFRLSPVANLDLPIIGSVLDQNEVNAANANYAAARPDWGHRNRVGMLDEFGLRRLMRAGLLVDLAHMSSASTDAALAIGIAQGYPLVYTHGGLRESSFRSERQLSRVQYAGLVASGGIFGLGTGYDPGSSSAPVAAWLRRYLDLVRTGPVALGSDLNGMAPQIRRSEVALSYPLSAIQDADWRTGGSGLLYPFTLGLKEFNVRTHGIAHVGMLPDFLAAVRTQAVADRTVADLDQVFHSAHDFVATWERAVRAAPSVDDDLPALPVDRLDLTVETGTDNLKCGGVMVTALAADGRQLSLPAMINVGLAPDSTYRMAVPLLPATPLPDVRRVVLQYLNNRCDPFDTGDTWNIRTLQVGYRAGEGAAQKVGLLIHKRGAPARSLDRGESWSIAVER